MNISIWISIGSLLVTSLILFHTWRVERNKTIRSKRAIIRAKGYKSGGTWIVNIFNDGEATAKNIRLISKDIEDDDGICLRIEKGKLPYPLLNAGDGFEIFATLNDGRNPVPIIKFVWDDDYKKDNEREQVLEF
jgi:hypothetical protein